MREKIGNVVSSVSPVEYLITVDPSTYVPLYEYVTVDLREGDANVRVVGQIVSLYRDMYTLRRDAALYSVVDAIGENVLEVHTARVKVYGYVRDGHVLAPRTSPRIGAPVYRASDEDVVALYGEGRGLCIGALMARPHITACVDVSALSRHLAIIAATGSGKTWASVVMIEELLKLGATVLVVDPHGEYVSLAHTIDRLGNTRAVVVKVARHQEGDVVYRMGLVDASPEALADAAGVPQGAKKIRYYIYVAHSVVRDLYKREGRQVGIDDMVEVLRGLIGGRYRRVGLAEHLRDLVQHAGETARRDVHSVLSAISYLSKLRELGIFAPRSTPLLELLTPRGVTVLNLAGVGEEAQDYIVRNVLERVFRARVRHRRGLRGVKYPYPVVVVVEEAHRFAPPKHLRRTWSYDVITRIASEGRKFGVHLVVITQRPSRVDPDVLSQCQSQIILRIVNPRDQEAVREASELLAQDMLANLPSLNPGEAVVLGPLLRIPAFIRLRDRVLEYGGGDIDLASAWAEAEPPDEDRAIDAVISRIVGSRPPRAAVRLAMSSDVVQIGRRGSIIVGTVRLGRSTAECSLDTSSGKYMCSACGESLCPHVVALVARAMKVYGSAV